MKIDVSKQSFFVLLGAFVCLVVLNACSTGPSALPDQAVEVQTAGAAHRIGKGLPAEADVPIVQFLEPCSDGVMSEGNCDARDVDSFWLFSSSQDSGAAYEYTPAATVEELMEDGLRLAGASPVHLAVRATPDEDSVRCGWRGVARSPGQRDEAIRFWLGLEAQETVPSANRLEGLFSVTFDVLDPPFIETTKSNFLSIARGGLSGEYLFLTCYADFTTQEYILGRGPQTFTLAYDRMGEARSYGLYLKEFEAGQFNGQTLRSRGEYRASLDEALQDAETALSDMIESRESVVFLAPMGAHNAIAVEAWQAVAQWDLQREETTNEEGGDRHHGIRGALRDPGGRPGAHADAGEPKEPDRRGGDHGRLRHQPDRQRERAERVLPADRGLRGHHARRREHGDFTPAQPPAKLSCASGAAVTSPATNRGLVHGCQALLDGKDTLRGTASLNWATALAVGSWTGVTTSGTPSRVTGLSLASQSLSGTIPAELGSLFELTRLDLSGNQLTGEIPYELGWLFNLTELRLTGNTLTGCIPLALKEVATNDLSLLNLLYCQPPAPEGLSAGAVGETSVALSWSAVANADKYRVEYRTSRAGDRDGQHHGLRLAGV